MQTIEPFEGRRISLLGEPNCFGFRHLPSFDTSRAGHATRRDAFVSAMRRPLQELYFRGGEGRGISR